MKFAEIIGQQELKEYFRRADAGERLAHAYIVEGSRGSGKRMLAEAAANFLLCREMTGGESCGRCRDCLQFASGNHPDVIYVQPSKKTGYGVDDIREMVLRELEIRPYQSRYKIYIIEAAESMTVPAQNVLLKTIEEPPAYALFFLLTENKDRLLETVLSRCIRLQLQPLSPAEMREFLKRHGRAENLEEALTTLQIALTERLRGICRRSAGAASAQSLNRYYFLARNLLAAKRQLKANVNKSLIIWSLFLLKENI